MLQMLNYLFLTSFISCNGDIDGGYNIEKLHLMADALIRYESLDTAQIDEIMKGKIPSPPSDWSDNNTPPGDGDGIKSDEAVSDNSSGDPEKPIGGPASSH